MMTDPAHPAVLAPKLASWAAALAVVTGAMVLVGWAFDIDVLKSVLPGWVDMKANTAVGFILTGTALLLTARPPAIFNPQLSIFIFRFARLCVLLVGLIGLLTLGEYVFGWNPGIDHWLFREPAGAVGTTDPGRMAPEAALCFVLLAAALWITGGTRRTRWAIFVPVSLGLLVTTFALPAILSYATPGLGTHGWFGLTIMSMHTAILFSMLGMAVIAISWQQDVLQWSLGRSATVAFACGMVLLVLIGFNANRSQFWLNEANRRIAYSEEAQDDIGSILIETVDAQAHTRGYIITGDERFLESYLAAGANGNTKLDALRRVEFALAGPMHQQHLAMIEAQVKAQSEWFQQAIDASRTGMTVAARNNMISHGEDLLDSLRITFDQVESEHNQFIRQLKQESESVSRLSYLIISIGTLASLLIFLIGISKLNFAVNERKRAEESLRKLSQAVEQSPSSIVISDLNANIEYVNEGFVKVTGYSRAEVIGQNPRILHSGKTPKATYEDMWAYLTRGEVWKGEFINRRKDGSEYTEEALVSPVRQPDGRVTHYLAIKQDITEFKLTQEALRSSRENLHRLLNSMAEGAYGVDTKGNCTFVNRAFLQLLGYQNENEVLGKHIHEHIHHSHADGRRYPESECGVYRAYRNNQSSNVTNDVFWRKDGVAIPVEFWAQPIVADGVVTGAIVTFTDITLRKKAEAALREKELLLLESQRIAHVGSWRFDLTGQVTWSDETYRIFGVSPDTFILNAESFLNCIHSDDQPAMQEWISACVAGNKPDALEFRINKPDGTVRYISGFGDLLCDVENRPCYITGMVHDITERKRAEDNLAASEALLKEFIQYTPAAIAMLDTQMRYIQCSERWIRDYHLSSHDIVGKSHYEIFPDVPQRWRDIHQRALAGATERCDEDQFLRADGSIEWLQWEVRPWHKAGGEIGGVIFFTQVITERKQAETKLAEQLEELRRWHDVTLGREGRVLDLKHEVNDLLSQTGKHPRYPSAESQDQHEK